MHADIRVARPAKTDEQTALAGRDASLVAYIYSYWCPGLQFRSSHARLLYS